MLSGTLLCRLPMLCARQRCRMEQGKHSSVARIIPGALSLTTNSGPARAGDDRKLYAWLKVSTFTLLVSTLFTSRSAAGRPHTPRPLSLASHEVPLGRAGHVQPQFPSKGE